VLYLASGVMLSRRPGAVGRAPARGEAGGREERKGAGRGSAKAPKAVQQPAAQADPEMAEIEAILRNRGIK
jgi:hypothetical protein